MKMSKHSFVTVSNRLPISVSKTDGKLEFHVSSGGLATAMSSLEQDDSIWVGWCGVPSEDLTVKDKAAIKRKFAEHQASPVFLSRRQVKLFYDGYSNDTIWPLFHYFQSVATYHEDYWVAYKEVNQLFVGAVKQVAQTGATVWVHDYHLMLLPQMLRETRPRLVIGFFLHIPFPSFEIFRLLPERSEIVKGLLGADVIGFHIYDYVRHFMSSCQRLMGLKHHEAEIEYEGRIVRVGTYPIGIDYAKFKDVVGSRGVSKHRRILKRTYGSQKLILSIDRLDYSKGIPERLEAFRMLLEQYPKYRGKIQLLMVAVPSRTSVESYKQLRDQIEQTVSRINGMYGTVDWTPISYQFQNRPFEEVVSLYSVADVMLVTPIRDGMNLVAKEYVASKQKSSGVLILSEMTGAADELPEALLINPNSAKSITAALDKALSMPGREQKHRLKLMQQRLKSYDVRAWSQSFTDDLELASAGGNRPIDKRMTAEQRKRLTTDYKNSHRRLLILDYDGTLKPFRSSPAIIAAFPSLKLIWQLRRITQQQNVTVAIVSGRPRRALQLWFRGLPLELAAEHGAMTRYGGVWRRVKNEFKTIKPKAREIMAQYTSKTAGAEIEEKDYSLVWHYRNVEPSLAYSRASKLRHELSAALSDERFSVHSGDKIIEVKQADINKGRVVKELIKQHSPDFILCCGDDYTDEDMFEELGSSGYTFKIGDGETKAKFRLDSLAEMVDLLDDLSDSKK
jgi:trehalose 6-phosphate synthase/phosphatase